MEGFVPRRLRAEIVAHKAAKRPNATRVTTARQITFDLPDPQITFDLPDPQITEKPVDNQDNGLPATPVLQRRLFDSPNNSDTGENDHGRSNNNNSSNTDANASTVNKSRDGSTVLSSLPNLPQVVLPPDLSPVQHTQESDSDTEQQSGQPHQTPGKHSAMVVVNEGFDDHQSSGDDDNSPTAVISFVNGNKPTATPRAKNSAHPTTITTASAALTPQHGTANHSALPPTPAQTPVPPNTITLATPPPTVTRSRAQAARKAAHSNADDDNNSKSASQDSRGAFATPLPRERRKRKLEPPPLVSTTATTASANKKKRLSGGGGGGKEDEDPKPRTVVRESLEEVRRRAQTAERVVNSVVDPDQKRLPISEFDLVWRMTQNIIRQLRTEHGDLDVLHDLKEVMRDELETLNHKHRTHSISRLTQHAVRLHQQRTRQSILELQRCRQKIQADREEERDKYAAKTASRLNSEAASRSILQLQASCAVAQPATSLSGDADVNVMLAGLKTSTGHIDHLSRLNDRLEAFLQQHGQ